MNATPLISVLCSSFNHEKFVGYFIESLQKQTYTNWELIIIDDCSTDNNVDEISKYSYDSRIHFSRMDSNSGSSIVTTKAFSLSNGDIIVDCASDDILKPEYFMTIIDIFNAQLNVGVIYNSLEIIDERNNPYNKWLKSNKSKYEILSELFYDQNVLLSPGMAVRRTQYKNLLPMNFACIQHQDYKWHIQLLLNTDCYIIEDPLVCYRVQRHKSKSLGTLNFDARNRVLLEENYLMDTFLNVKSTDLIKKIIKNNDFDDFSENEIPFVLGMSILKSDNIYKKQWGYKTLLEYFENYENYSLIKNKYNFQFKDFLELSNQKYFEILPKSRFVLLKKLKQIVRLIKNKIK